MLKALLTSVGLLGGLSLGREGPSVQIAAGVMLAARRFLPLNAAINARGLLIAGGSAGIAAAFNTPLAGVMFAIEELARAPEQRSSGLIVAGIVLAGLIAVSIEGNATHFGVIHPGPIGMPLLWPGLLVTLLAGAAGGLFARLLLASLNGRPSDFARRMRSRHPVRFAAMCGLCVAIIGIVSHGAIFGSSNSATAALLGGSAAAPADFAFHKLIATWLTVWSGVPGGIFAPSLSIGAGLGSNVAALTHYPFAPALIALGMVGFLAAATQAPLTSFIIVMEMVDGHAMVLSLMACAVVAGTISRVLSPPLYSALAHQQLDGLQLAPKHDT
jgi:H+/Cl- antiporter ClcA